jgi:chemotaxis protein MotB
LAARSEGDKKGLSDYFQSPLKVAMQGGSGAGASNSVDQGRWQRLDPGERAIQAGRWRRPHSKKISGDKKMPRPCQARSTELPRLSAKIAATISSNPKLSEFSSQIRLEITPDGLQIQIVDEQKRPMFDSGSATLKPYMRDILREIGTGVARR